MNTRKIWIFAVLFGILMSVTFFILTSNQGDTKSIDEAITQEEVEENSKNEETDDTGLLEIKQGTRAISIAVDEVQSVSGFVRPGSFVDIIAVSPLPVQENTTATIFLENVRVLAVGKTAEVVNKGDTGTIEPYQMVTLELSPSDGANLALVKENGRITLMLRGSEDAGASPMVNIP